MGLKGNLIAEFEIRSSGDLFYEVFATKASQFHKICPAHFQECGLHEGELGKDGAVFFYNYTRDGKACFSKKVVENLDEANKRITLREIEGDVLKMYKTFLVHLHVKSGGGNISLVNWRFEYEKLQEDTPHPTSPLEMILNFSKDIDTHLLKP